MDYPYTLRWNVVELMIEPVADMNIADLMTWLVH